MPDATLPTRAVRRENTTARSVSPIRHASVEALRETRVVETVPSVRSAEGEGHPTFGSSSSLQSQRRWSQSLFLEAGFRVTEAIKTRPRGESWALYDPDLGYRLRPGFADTNAAGLRDHPVTPKDGRFRILMLGDSVGYNGDSIDDTWVGRLRQQVQRSTGLGTVRYLERRHQRVHELSGAHLPEKVRRSVGSQTSSGSGSCSTTCTASCTPFKVDDGRIVGETYDFTPQAVASVDSMAFRLARRSHFLVWLRRSLAPAINNLPYRVGRGFAFDYRPDMNTAWKDSPWLTVKSHIG